MTRGLIDDTSMQYVSGDMNVINAFMADLIFSVLMRYGELIRLHAADMRVFL